MSVKLINNYNKLFLTSNLQQKIFSRFASNGWKLTYSEFGDPVKVIQKKSFELECPKDDEILIKMIAAPVNPADINTIQGKYPVKPEMPAVGGNEGLGEVEAVGANVKNLEVGDRVVPLCSGIGTWRTHMNVNSETVLKVPNKLGIIEAATITVNPCTAYRMLKDFKQLKPGDTVIQNGANSACGQNVIQICRSWGISTVNIVRDRPNLEELRQYLCNLGASYVLTEEELRKTDIFKTGKIAKPKLALNCVGGKNALEVLRHLQHGGAMVTYGGMSREPVTVPTSALIFKDVKILGFWMTNWSKQNHGNVDRFEMFEELISLMTSNELKGPSYKMVPFNEYKEALLNTMTVQGMIGKKMVLDFSKT